jgi:hypothetical protein
MEYENTGYKKILELLRKSRPSMAHPEDVENEIIKRIRGKQAKSGNTFDLLEILFGWAYISWFRRSLVAVSFLLVSVFIYQQIIILKQVKRIGNQPVVVVKNESMPEYTGALGSKLTIFKFSSKLTSAGEITVSDSQLEQLLESYDKLQSKYSNLLRIIEKDPELKEYIYKKLKDEENNKPEI